MGTTKYHSFQALHRQIKASPIHSFKLGAKGRWTDRVSRGRLIVPVTHTVPSWWRVPRNFSAVVSLGSLLSSVLLGISSLFSFQPLEALNLFRERMRKRGPITWYVVHTWCHSQLSGPPWVPRAVPIAPQARQCWSTPNSWHLAPLPLLLGVACKPCWPQGTFWKRTDVVKCISAPWQSCRGGLKALGLGSKHWVLPAQQSVFLSVLYETGCIWRFLPRNHKGLNLIWLQYQQIC